MITNLENITITFTLFLLNKFYLKISKTVRFYLIPLIIKNFLIFSTFLVNSMPLLKYKIYTFKLIYFLTLRIYSQNKLKISTLLLINLIHLYKVHSLININIYLNLINLINIYINISK